MAFQHKSYWKQLTRSWARGTSDSRAGGKTEKEVGENGLSGLKSTGENDAYFTWGHSAHINSARRGEDLNNTLIQYSNILFMIFLVLSPEVR